MSKWFEFFADKKKTDTNTDTHTYAYLCVGVCMYIYIYIYIYICRGREREKIKEKMIIGQMIADNKEIWTNIKQKKQYFNVLFILFKSGMSKQISIAFIS